MIAAFTIATVGNLYAKFSQRPSVVPILNGVLLLVPGGMGVQGVYKTLRGETLGNESGYAMSCVTVALSIAIGVSASAMIVFPKVAQAKTLGPLSM